jgi:hypothetical protein
VGLAVAVAVANVEAIIVGKRLRINEKRGA